MANEDDWQDDLDEFLAGEAAEEPDPEQPGELPPPDDADRANRYLRARNRIAKRAADIRSVAEAEVARTRAWAEDRTAGMQARVLYLDRLLEGWMRAINAADPNRKTEHLPSGDLTLRGQPYGTDVVDKEALRTWLWANRPDLLKIDPDPKAGDIKNEVLAYARAEAAAEKAARKGEEAPELPGGLRLGPVASETDEVVWYSVVTADGETVPGLVLTKPAQDKFSVKP